MLSAFAQRSCRTQVVRISALWVGATLSANEPHRVVKVAFAKPWLKLLFWLKLLRLKLP